MHHSISRRDAVAMLAAGAVSVASGVRAADASLVGVRYRIICDNDFGGDPDGLFQLAHQLLSPSVEVRLVVGSHLHEHEAWTDEPDQPAAAVARVGELLKLLPSARHVPVVAGAGHALASLARPAVTAAADAIIAEAMRETDVPLYYNAGAGLTDLATAWLLEPRIGRRLKLVWIGGPEYPGTARPPGPRETEYNLSIDTHAAQVVFNRSDIDIWQVPRSSYRQMLVSYQELQARVRASGPLGGFLVDNVEAVMRKVKSLPASMHLETGETYILGDSPLVTLTALQSSFQADPSSSSYELRARPTITAKGEYGKPAGGRPVRVYTRIDTRVTFEDLYAKLAAAGRAAPAP